MAAPEDAQCGVGTLQVESSDSPSKPEDYVIVGGYRLVKPYHFDFCCSMRQRWFGQNIIDIFTREFPARNRAYYLQALADGRLRVEGCQVTAETPLKDGQRMRHFIHRHEPPVPAGSIKVVGDSADVVAVCKPHGMPVHVAGQYRKNTVLGILTAERPDLGPLFPIHRLDKPVSGLLLFARSSKAAATLCRKIEGREVEKVYVARVLGQFPASDEPIAVDGPLAWDPVANHATTEPEGATPVGGTPEATLATASGSCGNAELRDATIASATGGGPSESRDGGQQSVADASLPEHQQQQGLAPPQHVQQQQQGQGQHAVSIQEERRLRKQAQKQQRKQAKEERRAAAAAAAAAAANKPSKGAAKPALTEFKLLAVAADGQTSIVECRPRTGRTHQIRVHLQYLGHPIANDTQYGGTYGGPLASRHMAQQLGVHWAAARGQASGNGGDRAAAEIATSREEETPAESGAEAGPGEVACNKRARVEARALASGGPGQAPAAAATAAADAAEGVQAAGGAIIAAEAPVPCTSSGRDVGVGPPGGEVADAYAQCQALRSRPEFQVAPELCDSLCIHCPFYAPRDYPLDLRPLWLHARSYSCREDGWSFATELPDWAHSGWQLPA